VIYYVRTCSRSIGSGTYVRIPPKISFLDPNPNPLDLVCRYEFLQKYLLDPKDLLLNDALVYLRRNPVCDKVLNLIRNLTEPSLKGKIRDQSVSTYVLDSLSVLTLATGI
jgi:hypothetical protein